MRFALMTEPQQGLGYDEILALARTAEESGLEAFFRSDHYASFPGASGLPTTDAWATLAGLARDTSSIQLGSLVSPVTFRPPGNLAKLVATVDEMSAGRVELGLGAGWNEGEHAQHGSGDERGKRDEGHAVERVGERVVAEVEERVREDPGRHHESEVAGVHPAQVVPQQVTHGR